MLRALLVSGVGEKHEKSESVASGLLFLTVWTAAGHGCISRMTSTQDSPIILRQEGWKEEGRGRRGEHWVSYAAAISISSLGNKMW